MDGPGHCTGWAPPLDPYARLSLRDRLELLAFELRFAGLGKRRCDSVQASRQRPPTSDCCVCRCRASRDVAAS